MKPAAWFGIAGLLAAVIAPGVPDAAAAAAKSTLTGARPHLAEPQSNATARLISEHTALIPGRTAYLGFTFDIKRPWHLYWDGASDTGMPPQVELTLPTGFTAEPLQWPAPKRHRAPGDLLDYIYEDQVTLLLPIAVPADAQPGSRVTISARLDWLECADVCLAQAADVSLTLPIAAPGSAEPARSPDATRFTKARERLPKPLPPSGSGVDLTWSGNTLRITANGAKALAFYPKAEGAAMVDPLPQGAADGQTLQIDFEPDADHPDAIGVLEITWPPPNDRKPTIYAIQSRVPDPDAPG